MQRRLTRKGHSKPAAEAAVQGLLSAGLLNDQQFAQHYAQTRSRRQRFGPRRLMADLRRMGIPEKDASTAVRDALEADGVDPRAVLREAAAKKVRSLGGLDPETARRRLRAYLLRRGFAGNEVASVVKDAVPR
jgi:regulatory protein